MRKIIAVTLCLCAFAVSASAVANRIEFYFSTSGSLDAIPTEYTNKTVPTVNVGEKAYLWAYVQGSTVRWTEVSLYFAGPVVTSGVMYDPATYLPDDPTTLYWSRWNAGGDKDPIGDNFVNMVGVPVDPVSGLGKNYVPAPDEFTPADGDWLTVGAPLSPGTTRHFLIGEVDFGDVGDVYLNVGSGFIVKSGTGNPPTDDIYFGFGGGVKEHIMTSGGLLAYGSDVGASTATPDLYVIPEPASLLLICLAGLALRRR